MYLASSCSLGVLDQAAALRQSSPLVHVADFLPLLSTPSSLLLSGTVMTRTESAAELPQHQGNISCIFQDILEHVALCFTGFFLFYLVTRCNLGLLLPLFSPATLFTSLVCFSSFSRVFSASYKRFLFCFKILTRSLPMRTAFLLSRTV